MLSRWAVQKVEAGNTKTLIIPEIAGTESNNCFILHCFEISRDKYYTVATEPIWHIDHIALRKSCIRAELTD